MKQVLDRPEDRLYMTVELDADGDSVTIVQESGARRKENRIVLSIGAAEVEWLEKALRRVRRPVKKVSHLRIIK